MNASTIINMVVRMVMRRVMAKGVNAGIDAATSRMSKGREPGAAVNTGDVQKRAKQTLRMGRKIGRM